MTLQTTACPRNCYSTCGMRVEVVDGRLRRIEAHPENRATPEGVCLKGLAYVERVHSPDRILTPLQRRADGGFEPVSWDAALSRIADMLVRLRQETGPQSLLYYQGSGTKGLLNGLGVAFWRLFGGCTTTYGDLCWPAGLEATRLTLGANEHNAPWDLVNARRIVLWGKNPAETNIHQIPFLEQAVDAGAHVAVVDPRRTETAERAHLHLRPRPGTDGALALAVARLLIERGWTDEAFVRDHVLGAQEYAALARLWPPERAATTCGLEVEEIEALAEFLGHSGPVTICAGFGMQRYTNSGQTIRAILGLLALTGNLGRPGAGWQFANLQSAIFDDIGDPLAFYPPPRPDGIVRVGISTARLGRDMLAVKDPPLRMAWVERGNPLSQNPESNLVAEAFDRLEMTVVVDQFLTDTARAADLVLPAKSMFEQSDVIGAYWHPYLQLRQKLLEPPGQVRPESEIYRALAERLALDPEAVDAVLPRTGDQGVEEWLERRLQSHPGLSLARLRQGPVLAPGAREVAFEDLRFPTPSGRVELRSEEAHARWGVDPLPAPVAAQEAPTPALEADGWLHLLTPTTKNRIHSQFLNLGMIRQLGERCELTLHPADAAERRLREGETVRVSNERGEMRLPLRCDPTLRRGCAVIPNGGGRAEGVCPNVLSEGRETDMGHGAAFHDNLVRVERCPS